MYPVQTILEYLQGWADPQLAEPWDNVGLLVDAGREVKKIMVTLDITRAVVEEAAEQGCELIVSHHPVIFKALKSLNTAQPAFLLAQKSISAICMHTNMDAAEGGVNDVLAECLGMQQVQPFAGLGRVGTIPTVTAQEFAKRCKQLLDTPVLLADAGKPVTTVAVVGGSGGEFFVEALEMGADCLLTGEASHHHGLDALEAGISLVVAGHFATEHPIVQRMADRLQQQFPHAQVVTSRANRAPFAAVE